jgi:hypothetical protein
MAKRRKPKDWERSGPSGFVIVDKPRGLTSHDVVDVARRWFGTRQVGHLGTLDPLATGVIYRKTTNRNHSYNRDDAEPRHSSKPKFRITIIDQKKSAQKGGSYQKWQATRWNFINWRKEAD